MTTPLTIVARIEAQPDHVDRLRNALLKLIEPTRAEEGCLQYDLHQDQYDPTVFLFFENWRSRELWQAHLNSEHIAAYRKESEGAVFSFTLNEMAQIG